MSNTIINSYNHVIPVPVPPTISNLYAWYDSSDSSTITKSGSDRISSWTNKEGTTARDMVQAAGGTQPLWISAGKNSLDTIDFVGAKYMTTSSVLPSVSVPITTFVVCKNPASDSTVRHSVTNLLDDGMNVWYKETNDTWRYSASTGGAVEFTDAALLGVWNYVTFISNGTSSNISVNGSLKATTPSSALGTARSMAGLCIGTYGITPASAWNDQISEVIIYDKLLNATEIGIIESYIATKWAI